jgi:hypothetical protein
MPEKTNPLIDEIPTPDMANLGAEAPWIYFDGVVNFATYKGIVQIELGANILTPAGAKVAITAHLRCGAAGATALRDVIDKALLVGMPTEPTPMGKTN